MSEQATPYMPDDAMLRELGRMQILHGQLDHMLRLVIKRALVISIDDPGYWNQTDLMTGRLREVARKRIDERYKDDDDTAGVLNKALDEAAAVTALRNRALHGVWMHVPGREPVLLDRDKELKEHVTYALPTVEEISNVSERIARAYGARAS